MLSSSSEQKKFIIDRSRRFDEQLAAESERTDLVLEAEAFELESGADRQENMVALGSQRSRG
jgi:hypothetical protein